jgi:hypothetical protein
MKLKTQIDYLMRSLECLAESLITIQPNQNLRPSTVNITYSRETQKGIAVKYMMGASVHCKVPMNYMVASLRVQNMQTLYRASDVENVLTRNFAVTIWGIVQNQYPGN